MSKKKRVFKQKFALKAALIFSIGLLLFSLATSKVLAVVTVVSPSNMQGWAFEVNSPDGFGTFVIGPSTPPRGIGSARLFSGLNGNTSIAFHNVSFANIKLTDVSKLEYSTYKLGSTAQYPKLSLFIDTGNPVFGVERLNFSPESQTQPDLLNNTTAVPDVWQTWDALSGFWSASTSGCDGTIAEYLACLSQFGDVTSVAIVNTSDIGGIRIQVGTASSGDVLDTNVDNFTIGIGGGDITFDFEPDVLVLPSPSVSPGPILPSTPTNKDQCKNGGWNTFRNPTFKNQGDCIKFVK